MGISCQETNQKLNGHHLFPKGTTPCISVLVINFKNQSHIPDTTVPFQSVCSPVLKSVPLESHIFILYMLISAGQFQAAR